MDTEIRWLSLRCLDKPLGAIAQLCQIDLTRMESLTLGKRRIGMYTGDPAFRFQDGNWPALTYLDLSYCGLQNNLVVQLTSGKWPLLQKLNLSQNFLSLQRVPQLVAGHWPDLCLLDLRHNQSDNAASHNLCDSSFSEEYNSFVKSVKVKWPAVQLHVTMTCRQI